jgi:hypothetical protein
MQQTDVPRTLHVLHYNRTLQQQKSLQSIPLAELAEWLQLASAD